MEYKMRGERASVCLVCLVCRRPALVEVRLLKWLDCFSFLFWFGVEPQYLTVGFIIHATESDLGEGRKSLWGGDI